MTALEDYREIISNLSLTESLCLHPFSFGGGESILTESNSQNMIVSVSFISPRNFKEISNSWTTNNYWILMGFSLPSLTPLWLHEILFHLIHKLLFLPPIRKTNKNETKTTYKCVLTSVKETTQTKLQLELLWSEGQYTSIVVQTSNRHLISLHLHWETANSKGCTSLGCTRFRQQYNTDDQVPTICRSLGSQCSISVRCLLIPKACKWRNFTTKES